MTKTNELEDFEVGTRVLYDSRTNSAGIGTVSKLQIRPQDRNNPSHPIGVIWDEDMKLTWWYSPRELIVVTDEDQSRAEATSAAGIRGGNTLTGEVYHSYVVLLEQERIPPEGEVNIVVSIQTTVSPVETEVRQLLPLSIQQADILVEFIAEAIAKAKRDE